MPSDVVIERPQDYRYSIIWILLRIDDGFNAMVSAFMRPKIKCIGDIVFENNIGQIMVTEQKGQSGPF